jgi:hypothetical protein
MTRGTVLAKHRKDRGLRHPMDFCRLAKCSLGFLGRIEERTCHADPRIRRRFAEVLGVHESELWDVDGFARLLPPQGPPGLRLRRAP